MAEEIAIGILGWGNLARRTLSPAISSLSGVRLEGIGTRYIGSAKNVPDDVEVFSYDELVAHSEVRAIHVANTNELHLPWIKKALEAGKHVLCEKPMALGRPEDVRVLVGMAKAKGLVLAEAFMYRHHAQYKLLKSLLDEQRIGSLRRLDINFAFNLDDRRNSRWQKECWGGALADVGCYGLDMARWLFGSAKKIQGFSLMDETSFVDKTSSWLMDHGAGMISRVHVSMVEQMSQKVLIQGERGQIELPHAFIPSPGKRVHLLVRDEKGQEVIKCEPSNAYQEEWKAFLQSIEAGQLMAPLENGLENAEYQQRILSGLEKI
jgi:predicted dehydrogenase